MTKFIADIGSNWNADIERGKELIRQAKYAGCWGVKFQMFKADRLFVKGTPDVDFDKLKKSELSIEQFRIFMLEAKKYDVKIGVTPFDRLSLESIKALPIPPDFIKISSFDIKRINLIREVRKLNLPIIFSTGLATTKDIEEVIENLLSGGTKPITINIMHCVSEYPTVSDRASLDSILNLKQLVGSYHNGTSGLSIGYSDHSASKIVLRQALIYGLEYLEFHLDLDCYQFNQGWERSAGHCWIPQDIKEIIDEIETVKLCRVKRELGPIDLLQRADPSDGLRPSLKARTKRQFYKVANELDKVL